MSNSPRSRRDPFVPLPSHPRLGLAWPTPNRFLFDSPDRFFARTRANAAYGRPGWTRDCGRRLHQGCDIAPIQTSATGQTTTVEFTDCLTGREYPSQEPTWIPQDSVFCLYDGYVNEAIADPATSDFGIHAVVRHQWPQADTPFFSLYAHLAKLDVKAGELVPAGHRLGTMGTTSRIPDAQKWMAIAPHLHIEIWNSHKRPFNPEKFLRSHLTR